MRQPREPGHLGRPRRAVRAVLRRAARSGAPRSGWSPSVLAVLLLVRLLDREAAAGGPARLVGLGARGRPARRRAARRSPSAGSSSPSRPPTPRCRCSARPGPWYLAIAAVAAVLFALHNRRSKAPLVPHGAFAQRPAWGAILVSFFVGAALIAALVDIPIFARITDRRRLADQGGPGAGRVPGRAAGRRAAGRRTHPAAAGRGRSPAVGMVLATLGFWLMAGWGLDSLHHLSSSAVLAMTGLGFGLALAPVNAALLASTADAVHGVTSALLVVARMVGMLVGISALTTIGLRRYYAVRVRHPLAQQRLRRRQDPVRGVHPADRAGRHRAAAGDLPRRRHLRGRRRGRGGPPASTARAPASVTADRAVLGTG